MADNNNFGNTVESLFKGMENFLTTKTVVGEAIPVGDSLMIPLADVSFGLGAGAFAGNVRNNGGGGMGARVSPTAVLMVAKDGTTRLVTLKNTDAASKILEMAPDLISRIAHFGSDGGDAPVSGAEAAGGEEGTENA